MIDKGVSFLLNSHTFVKGDNPQIDTNYAKFDSLSTTINGNYAENLPTTSYQYVVLVEEDTMESYCGSASQQQEVSQPCSPFEKYTAQDEKINSDHKKDTYIRNDGAAKAYRDLTDNISKLFSGVDGTSAGNFLALQ
jgi:hypothetical protein